MSWICDTGTVIALAKLDRLDILASTRHGPPLIPPAVRRELLAKVGLHESPAALITDLGVGKQQLVEIAKALSKEVKLLILDEPTASLNEKDSDALLELLQGLKAHGITCILISHKLHELTQISNRITVIRDGQTIETMALLIQRSIGPKVSSTIWAA